MVAMNLLSISLLLLLVTIARAACGSGGCCPCPQPQENETAPVAENADVAASQRESGAAETMAVGAPASPPAPKKTGGCGMPTAFFAWAPGHKMEVLFTFWTVNSYTSYILTCIVIFLLGFAFEGFQTVQQLADERLKQINADQKLKLGESCCKSNKFTKSQEALRAFLHACRVFLSLMLMLIFMLFEWGTAMSLVAGAGLGFFVFHVWSPLKDSASSPRQAGCH